MILRFLFYAFLIYMLYQLVFHFIIPVYRTTKQVKRGFREMQERMHQHGAASSYPPEAGTVQQSTSAGKKGAEDYIDFEEVKD